ncbi:MAG: hypothetical protein IJX71_04060 [Oscillospiraceae bacterium]|nr:hypothetical protein [Oscillospiraceae bacterium]
MKLKNVLFAASLAILLICGAYAGILMGTSQPTYDGTDIKAMDLYEDPSSYDNSTADGAAAIIVNENLEKTAADNVVFSVVFNFRGYDTLGESFILIASITGSLVILRKAATPGKKEKEEE